MSKDWKISEEYTTDEQIAIEVGRAGMVLIEREVNKEKEDMQQANLIVRAVNEYDQLKAKEALFDEMLVLYEELLRDGKLRPPIFFDVLFKAKAGLR